MSNTPVIRFKGFSDAWEQRKLEDVVEFLDTLRKPLEGAKRVSGPYPYYGASGIVDYVDGYIFDEELILLSEDGANITDRNYPVCFLASGKYWVNNHAHVLKCKDGNENNFICNSLERKDYKQYNSGMAMPKLNQEVCKGIPVSCPKYEEQKKIGDYFRSLDNLITLHQRKCDETKILKKYMLQKMFPKKGESVPEIRFEGFTGAWEQRKLGEVFEQTTNLVNPNDGNIELWSLTVEDGLTPKSERYNREFLVKKDDNFKEVRPGDIVYNPMNMTLGAVGYNGMAKSVAVSGYYTTMIAKESYDSYYINTWLKSPQAILMYRTYATGSLIEKQRVQFPTLSIIPVLFPKYEEQKKIGEYFSNLDNLITLHQHKCDELKEIKKYMLQNMFVK